MAEVRVRAFTLGVTERWVVPEHAKKRCEPEWRRLRPIDVVASASVKWTYEGTSVQSARQPV